MTAVSFRVDEFMRDRAAAIFLLLSEDTGGNVDVKHLQAVIRDAKDLVRRLERQLPRKLRAQAIERFAVWYWTPYQIGGGKQEFMASFATKEEAIGYAMAMVTEGYPGLQYAKIVDATDHSTTDIVTYPSLTAGPGWADFRSRNGNRAASAGPSARSARNTHEEGAVGRGSREHEHEPGADGAPQAAANGTTTSPAACRSQHAATSEKG